MSDLRAPGVQVIETLLPRDTGTVTNSQSRAVIVGPLQRGATYPVTVRTWSEFRDLFGDWTENTKEYFSAYPYNQMVDAAYNYFGNIPRGGSTLTVLRVVDRNKSAYAITDITDESVKGAKANKVMFRIRAASPGIWGNRIRVAVVPIPVQGTTDFDATQFDWEFGDPSPLKFNLYVYYQAPVAGAELQLVERFLGVGLGSRGRNYVETLVNSGSRYINILDTQKDTAMQPTEISTVSPKPLTGGLDGNAPSAGDYADALTALDDIPTALTITAPGCDDQSIVSTLSQYAAERGDSFCVISVPDRDFTSLGNGPADWVQGLTKNSFSAAYYPDVYIPDPLSRAGGLLRPTSNAGLVLGAYTSNDYEIGVWRTPAGPSAYLRSASQPTRRLSNQTLASLNNDDPPINVIRRVNGVGTCIMGGRTLDQRQADRYVGIRRSLSYIKRRLMDLTEFALFEPNGPDLWAAVNTRLSNWLGLYYQQGALRGTREPQAFYVVCDASNNTTATIEAGELHITVGVAVEYPAEFIVIRLTQANGTVRVA